MIPSGSNHDNSFGDQTTPPGSEGADFGGGAQGGRHSSGPQDSDAYMERMVQRLEKLKCKRCEYSKVKIQNSTLHYFGFQAYHIWS